MKFPGLERLGLPYRRNVEYDLIDVERRDEFPLGDEVDLLLADFVDRPKEYRMVMKETRSVISGGLVLQFLVKVRWLESDMDVFTCGERSARQMVKYLADKEGYSEESADWTPRSECESFEVTTLTCTKYGRQRVIQIMYHRGHSSDVSCVIAEAILKGFYSTALLNFITWNKVYCLFPVTTIKHREMCMLSCSNLVASNVQNGVSKYERRGWKLAPFRCNEGEVREIRRIGDKFTKVLDIAGMEGQGEMDDPLERCWFVISKRKEIELLLKE
jgi:hypothetical protein